MTRKISVFISQLVYAVALSVALLLIGSTANAQETSKTENDQAEVATTSRAEPIESPSTATAANAPVYTDFMGVRLGMSAEDVRQKLENLKDKGKTQDFFVFSDFRSAQVFYDGEGKVVAISADYVGAKSDPPTPEMVIGESPQVKPDGSMYGLKRYPDAGYWVAYSRTAGKDPITTVTMQKI